FRVKGVNVIQDDLNLTFPEDLLYINLMELKRRNEVRLIGKNARVINDRLIENSIIGNNVEVKREVRIRNSVIFSDTVIEPAEDIENTIITPDKMIYCYNSVPREDLLP
ncbi:MAG: hypothetical protein NTZ51_07905, partial [Proteobacteria bacterium]|nr:hypothetical protein [Pseudomonadota bacterium]